MMSRFAKKSVSNSILNRSKSKVNNSRLERPVQLSNSGRFDREPGKVSKVSNSSKINSSKINSSKDGNSLCKVDKTNRSSKTPSSGPANNNLGSSNQANCSINGSRISSKPVSSNFSLNGRSGVFGPKHKVASNSKANSNSRANRMSGRFLCFDQAKPARFASGPRPTSKGKRRCALRSPHSLRRCASRPTSFNRSCKL